MKRLLHRPRIVIALGLCLAVVAALAATPPDFIVSSAQLSAVAARISGAKVSDLRPTPVPGIYEYKQGAQIAYVTEDGRFAFNGDLYLLADKTDLTDSHRRALRLSLLAALPESSMVIFEPKDPKDTKYTITVFTDVDCQYCRLLHSQIADYNRLGVRVRYLSFPRTGPNTESWFKAEKVWCSADRQVALTEAKLGRPLAARVCSPNPVNQEYELGKAIGLDGTPGIVTESGDLLPGYLPPPAMIEELKADANPAAAGPS
ncbi:MAG TPA: thioredoxin fold domain-containing protein [Steroidobacteraceae bacterium]